jgi:hypothetical protein
MKEKPFSQVCDHDWICDYGFCIDTSRRANKINDKLQGANRLVSEIYYKMTAFEKKF